MKLIFFVITAPLTLSDPQKMTDADKIRSAWSEPAYQPSAVEVKTAALLALEGYINSVKNMRIMNRMRGWRTISMDITDISCTQMEKLTSIVTKSVMIGNMTPTRLLGSILAAVRCPKLVLGSIFDRMVLSKEDTRALVTALRDRVERVTLDNVTLDVDELITYDGQGHCRVLNVGGRLGGIMKKTCGGRLQNWAENVGWTVDWADALSGWMLCMKRK